MAPVIIKEDTSASTAPEEDVRSEPVISLEEEEGEVEDKGHSSEAEETEQDSSAEKASKETEATDAPPLPDEAIPPLPSQAPPSATVEEDDGWAPIWEESAQAFYFYNRFTGASQWTNPRVPEAGVAVAPAPPGVQPPLPAQTPTTRPTGGYDPAIHGDYDPTAWYAQTTTSEDTDAPAVATDPSAAYGASAAFNRFTGRFQNAELTPDNFNDENKSKRQMSAFFDVDAAANSHDGRSLKEERSGKRLSKAELKSFKEKRKAKKEEKRRAWLRD